MSNLFKTKTMTRKDWLSDAAYYKTRDDCEIADIDDTHKTITRTYSFGTFVDHIIIDDMAHTLMRRSEQENRIPDVDERGLFAPVVSRTEVTVPEGMFFVEQPELKFLPVDDEYNEQLFKRDIKSKENE